MSVMVALWMLTGFLLTAPISLPLVGSLIPKSLLFGLVG